MHRYRSFCEDEHRVASVQKVALQNGGGLILNV
jgi:hypothetical protein